VKGELEGVKKRTVMAAALVWESGGETTTTVLELVEASSDDGA
jgi:hypothetical protein